MKSMTGYGRVEKPFKNKTLSVEIRSLNSKFLDLNLRLPSIYKDHELELRNFLNPQLVRGKVDLAIQYTEVEEQKKLSINKNLAKAYYEELKPIAEELGHKGESLLAFVLKMPDVFTSEKKVEDEEEWEAIKELINEVINVLNVYREDEGKVLDHEIRARIEAIMQFSEAVQKLEPERMTTVKERIKSHFEEAKQKADDSRFEQEMIYYLEKLDVTEEIVRLKNNCEYFLEIMNGKDLEKGKKLGFISQEIGREINTLGSKANHFEIQKLVIQMKDELEKVKEQLNNIL